MNNRPNQHLLDIAIAKMRGAGTTSDAGKSLLQQVRKERLSRFERAKSTAPRFIPVLQTGQTFACKGTGATNEIFERYTIPRNYDLLLTGLIANPIMGEVQVQAVMSEEAWSNDFIDLRQVAGQLNQGAPDYVHQPVPQLLRGKDQMLVKFKNTFSSSNTQYMVFQALKVFPITSTDASPFDSEDQKAIDDINADVPQRTIFLDMVADFSAPNNVAGARVPNVQTNQVDTPLIVYGISTNGINCLIELKDTSDDSITAGPCPLGAVAQNIVITSNNAKAQPYIWFVKPFYLPANAQFTADFTNGLGSSVETALVQTTFICTTP